MKNWSGIYKKRPRRKFDATAFSRQYCAKPGILDVYTDGSHIKGTPRMGCGAYGVYDGREMELSVGMTSAELKRLIGHEVEPGGASNPTMELCAAIYVIEKIVAAQRCPPGIRIFADYEGVIKYGMEQWDAYKAKAKTPHFRAAAIRFQEATRILRKRCTVAFVHVPGHAGVDGNTRADALAKAGSGVDTFGCVLE